MATISSREPNMGFPFSNPWDISDGATPDKSTGIPYMYFVDLEMSVIDLKADNRMSLSVTLDQGGYCQELGIDAQDPPCPRVILTGSYVAIEEDSAEFEFAREALFTRHPQMEFWPHDFYFAKMDIKDVILLAAFGGANHVSLDDYFNATLD